MRVLFKFTMFFSGVVMIRCDIKKGKQPLQQSLNKPPWDAAPRAADGFVLDLGNIGHRLTSTSNFKPILFSFCFLNSSKSFKGFRGGSSQYPQIRGDNYVEADPLSLQSAGPPQTRIFRNSQQAPQQTYQPQQQAAYPATYDHRDLAGYSFQNINGQYINTGKK